ncbi:MAG: hypothetical protein KDD50_03965 [Bdellovibrionales bacterium]|nr:hypothetical protein [Bdellovibrionales bacterium]
MGILSAKKQNCYCAFCKGERLVYDRKHISVLGFFVAVVSSLSLTLVLWSPFNEMAALFFIVFMSLGELFAQMRWRAYIVCPYCGFDPIVYSKDPEKAAQKVKMNLVEYKNNPLKLLSKNNPFIQLPIRKVRPEEAHLKEQVEKRLKESYLQKIKESPVSENHVKEII